MRRCGLMALIMLIAFSVRMIHVQVRPLWYDEAFAVLYASLSPAQMLYGTATPVEGAGAADVHPLLYYLLLHGWMDLAGRSPLAVRYMSVALGMVTVALLWRLAAWCFGRLTGLAVGLLAATNPFHVAYSQETRMYALLGLAAVVAAWGLLRVLVGRESMESRYKAESRSAVNWWGVYAVGAVLTLYAHNLGAFVLLALHLLVVTHRRWWGCLRALFLADLVVLALFSPWLIGVLPGQVGFIGRGYWLAAPSADEVIRTFMLPVLTFYEPAPVWVLGLGLFVGLLVLVLVALRSWQAYSRVGWFLLLCWVPVLSLMLVSRWRPVYVERALLPSALFYLAAVGWLLIRGGLPGSLRLVLAALITVSVTGSLVGHYTYAGFPRPPFQEAIVYLDARIKPMDVIVHTNKLTYFPMHVYAPRLDGTFLADPPGSPQDTLASPTQEALGIFPTSTIGEAVGEAQRVWLIYFPREIQEVQALEVEHPALSWLANDFIEEERRWFGDLVVALHFRKEK